MGAGWRLEATNELKELIPSSLALRCQGVGPQNVTLTQNVKLHFVVDCLVVGWRVVWLVG